MAVKSIIARGIGFSPGSVKFIVTAGFLAAATAAGRTLRSRAKAAHTRRRR